jgi:hypothetical protein
VAIAANQANRARSNAEFGIQMRRDIFFQEIRAREKGVPYKSPYHDAHNDIFMQSMSLLGITMGTAGTSFLATYYATSSGTTQGSGWTLAIVPAVVVACTAVIGGLIIYGNQPKTQKPDPKFSLLK